MNIPKSYSELPNFEELPWDQQNQIRKWIKELERAEKPLQKSLERVAKVMGCSFPTARRKYYAFKNSGDWHVLINYAKLSYFDKERKTFNNWWHDFCLQHKNAREAYREFLDLFKGGMPIPGLATKERGHPHSYDVLIRHAPTKFEKQTLASVKT